MALTSSQFISENDQGDSAGDFEREIRKAAELNRDRAVAGLRIKSKATVTVEGRAPSGRSIASQSRPYTTSRAANDNTLTSANDNAYDQPSDRVRRPGQISSYQESPRSTNDSSKQGESKGSFIDDMASPAPNADDEPKVSEASPAYVQPTTPSADSSTAPGLTPERDSEIPQRTTPKAAPSPVDPAHELNQSPDKNAPAMPLISEDGAPVGLPAAYAGDNYEGKKDGVIPGGTSNSDSTQTQSPAKTEDNPPIEDPLQAQSMGGLKGAINQRAERVMSLMNRKKINDIQKKINEKQQEIKKNTAEAKKYKSEHITPLEWKRMFATFTDTVTAIWNYWLAINGTTFGIWWLSIIGVIIDICVVWPLIAIYYGVGIIKGPVRRYCDHEIARHTEKLKKIEARRKPLEREVRELEQEQFQLTQLFKAEQSAQEPRKGAPPSVGGIPLAT